MIAGILVEELGADGVEGVRGHAFDDHFLSSLGFEGERDGDADEVDVGNVDVELEVVVSELGETPAQIIVGVRGVVDRRLDDGRAWVDEEGEWAVFAVPDARACEARNGDGPYAARRAERDGAIDG